MPAHTRILEQYHQRLSASIGRSPLLKVSAAKTGRLLDLTRLGVVSSGLPRQLLSAVTRGQGTVSMDLDRRMAGQTARAKRSSRKKDGEKDTPADDALSAAERAALEQAEIYDLLDKRMFRHAELARRETGVHALWLGYPLLHVDAGTGEERQFVLAPVFLWPISIEIDLRHEGRIRVRREDEAGSVRMNVALAAWVRRMLNLELACPSEEELLEFPWEELKEDLQKIAQGFRTPPSVDCDAVLEAVPSLKLLSPQQSPRYYNSAVLGYFRWPNEAILADLESLKNRESCEGVSAAFVSALRLPTPPSVPAPAEEDRYLVCDADFSQERVIWQARAEPGLMVHGPPGTGKSQTIVNLIADALARGRRILMVCQKQAATRVVLERLRAAGLADLCLEVHDAESDRMQVFKAVREQADLLPASVQDEVSARRRALAQEITALEEELDRYAQALHEPHPRLGISYGQMKAREGRIYAQFPSVRMLPGIQDFLADLPAAELDALCGRVETVGGLFRQSDALHNPWRFRQPSAEMSPALGADVRALEAQLRALDARHQEQVQRAGAGLGLPPSLADFPAAAAGLLEPLNALLERPDELSCRLVLAWLMPVRASSEEECGRLVARCREASELAQKAAETQPDARWSEVCRGMPLGQLDVLRTHAQEVLAHRGRWLRVFSLRFRRARDVIRQLRPDAAGEMLWMVAEAMVSHVQAQHLREQLDRAEQALVPGVRPPLRDESSLQAFTRQASKALEEALALARKESASPWARPLVDAALDAAKPERFRAIASEVQAAVQRAPFARDLLDALSAAEAFLGPSGLEEPRTCILTGQALGPWLDRLTRGLASLDTLATLDLDRRQRRGALKTLLDGLEAYEARRGVGEKLPAPPADLAPEAHGRWWVALLQYTAARMGQTRSHQDQPLLVEITPEVHAGKVGQLRERLGQKRALEAQAIRTRWLGRAAACRSQPWKRMFQLRRSQHGDAKRMREAVSLSLTSGLLDLRPCWLANPESVAEIFPLQPGLFDLVIFDEASQCPIEQAVPVIFRGRSLVVAGDEKQLPPTSFFSARLGTDGEGEESAGTEDEEAVAAAAELQQAGIRRMDEGYLLQVEDLLQASMGNLPESYLTVHYRSETPDLIQFSNRAFYGGRLEAPPARTLSTDSRRPIQYHDVAGVYDQRTNREEARKVIAILREYWIGQATSPTLGVVTFNQFQRDLIEDLIGEECQRDEAFATRYQVEMSRKESNQDVGFFVKNLENVQGDERDVMIFSTTFGRDGTGKFFRRFGPVGALGGERRLNVAVTRARQRVILVGSMPIGEVSSSLGSNETLSSLTPACCLQLYLAYAQAVSGGDEARARAILERFGRPAGAAAAGPSRDPIPPLVQEVGTTLEKLGYQVRPQVGEAGFRIDLGVLHPQVKDSYLLGIECDGPAHLGGRTARIRDVWREEVLRRRGWKLHRVWSTRWWYYRNEETDKLQRALEEALRA
ncbi:MAG: DUF4011 domain-containing protein [Planctomycetes bacterium]|nr:DUF4011 domain-containing protein [Planctomycetota bacterium]